MRIWVVVHVVGNFQAMHAPEFSIVLRNENELHYFRLQKIIPEIKKQSRNYLNLEQCKIIGCILGTCPVYSFVVYVSGRSFTRFVYFDINSFDGNDLKLKCFCCS